MNESFIRRPNNTICEALSLLQLGAKETDGELRKVDLLVPPLVAEPLEAWVLSG